MYLKDMYRIPLVSARSIQICLEDYEAAPAIPTDRTRTTQTNWQISAAHADMGALTAVGNPPPQNKQTT